MRRKSDWRFAGCALMLVGFGIAIWANIDELDLVGIGRVSIIVGAVVVAYAKLKERTGANHEAFMTGYDRGREDGFQEGQKAKLERPVVVGLDSRRCSCGKKDRDSVDAPTAVAPVRH